MMGFTKNSLKAVVVGAFLAGALALPVLGEEKSKDKPEVDTSEMATAIIADAREFCDRIASNDMTVQDALQAAGWEPQIDSFGEVPFYHEIEGAMDYPGVGRADIWGFVEFYPSHIIGYCTFEILEPGIDFPIAEIVNLDGLSGEVETTDQGTYASMSNDVAPFHKLIHARQTVDSFFYQVTDMIERDD